MCYTPDVGNAPTSMMQYTTDERLQKRSSRLQKYFCFSKLWYIIALGSQGTLYAVPMYLINEKPNIMSTLLDPNN